MALPRLVGLQSKSNGKYLHYIKEDNDDDEVQGFLRFSGEGVVSPYAKFEVELSKNWAGAGLVNIRCVYNNKYFVSKSQELGWIVAAAKEPEEDKSKWSCTLFQPVFVDTKTTAFRHVYLGHYATVQTMTNDAAFDCCISAGRRRRDDQAVDDMDQINDMNVFTITDWQLLVILPKHVAFKGENGLYLRSMRIGNRDFLQFSSEDIGDPSVGQETFITSNGSIRLRSNLNGRFWRRSPNWILPDSTDTSTNNRDTLFSLVQIDDHTVSLRNLGNNNFCKRFTADGNTDCLNAAVSTIDRYSRLEVEELVLSRSIYNVNYHLLDSRIYDERVITMANGNAVNRAQEPTTVDIRLTYTETTSKTWNSSVSVRTGVEAKFRAGIPIIADGTITVSTEVAGEWEWGTTEESSTELETIYQVTVPPMSKVKVSLFATMSSCDVPFSYRQRDVLVTGETVTYNLDDGVYHGVDSYNFRYESHEEKL
ncbi:hypothetical protein LguiA_024444 [Lonicera macranthoides]